MEYIDALEWIHSRLPFGSRPGLERINALLELVDNPQDKIQTVHIGGTNGKGSTVTFLRSLLEEQGMNVGTFTSPYITVFNERIAINNEPIPNQALVALVKKFQPLVAVLDQQESLAGATEFEIITAMMFDYFYQQGVDLAIVEVGLGGALDCTNVITPLIAGITTIGLDHMDILGSSLAEIAAQKAGILKQNRPLVLGKITGEALTVIEKQAAKLNNSVSILGEDYSSVSLDQLNVRGERFSFQNTALKLSQLEIGLIGKHQIENASMAIELYCLLAKLLTFEIKETDLRNGLNKARWAGRMEVLNEQPLIMIDGAHNEPAIQVLVDNLATEFAGRKIYTVFAALRTKDVHKMLTRLGTVAHQHLYLTTFVYPKAYGLAEYPLASVPGISLMTDWQTGIAELTEQLKDDDVLLITGSLYFISQVRTFLMGGNDD